MLLVQMPHPRLADSIFVAAVLICASAPLVSGQLPALASVVLNVRILPTSSGADPTGDGRYAEKYPKTIRVEVPTSISGRISAYGVAYRVWIAPKGWTGTATIGGDGSTDADLHPVNGSSRGPRFHYENSGGCAGCALHAAAPYFPDAMQSWKELFGFDTPAPLPSDLRIVRVSQKLMTYSSSSGADLLMQGVVYFDGSEPLFEKDEFVLPRADAPLLNFLVQRLISAKQ